MKLPSSFRTAHRFKLVPLIERAIAQGDFEWTFDYSPKRGDDGWHPSGHCTPSLQELYRHARGELKDEIRPSLYKTFMVGHFWHQYLQTLMVENGLAEPDAIERSGESRWGLGPFQYATGSGDIAPAVLPHHGEYLVDIKTMNGHDFRGYSMPEWTKDKWECQVNIYMDFFDLERALILGVQKDSPHDLREFEFRRNQPLIDAIYLKWRIVSECLESEVLPPADEEVQLPLNGAVV